MPAHRGQPRRRPLRARRLPPRRRPVRDRHRRQPPDRPPGELRVLEYGQRLGSQRRDTLLAREESSTGATLHALTGLGGAQALAQPTGTIEADKRCDLFELDRDHPALAGQTTETVLDARIFSSASETIVRTVLGGGRVVVSDGQHPLPADAARRAAKPSCSGGTNAADAGIRKGEPPSASRTASAMEKGMFVVKAQPGPPVRMRMHRPAEAA
jgi:hypothetical protein